MGGDQPRELYGDVMVSLLEEREILYTHKASGRQVEV